MRRAWDGLCVAFLVGLLTGCEADKNYPPGPVAYDSTFCISCRSIIRDPRFAAQYFLPGGRVKMFDDPGCLVQALEAEPVAPAVIYLRAYENDQWLNATETWLARTPSTASPRGYGWAAYASFGAAQEAVTSAGDGEVLRFEDARKKIAQASGK